MREHPILSDDSRHTPECVAIEYSDPDATRGDDRPLADFPAIARLRLTPPEFDALKIQGHVSRERRGDREVFKLRYRIDGKQFVRYVASHPERAPRSSSRARRTSTRPTDRPRALSKNQARRSNVA